MTELKKKTELIFWSELHENNGASDLSKVDRNQLKFDDVIIDYVTLRLLTSKSG